MALTGFGLCFPIIMMITAFLNLIGAGGAPKVAIDMGKGEDSQTADFISVTVAASLFAYAIKKS